MHSSRIRTGGSLTVCRSLLWGWGVYFWVVSALGGGVSAPGGGVCFGGVCSRGVSQHALRQTPPLLTESQTRVKT